MNQFKLSILFLFISISIHAQDFFEGELQYGIEYQSNSENLPVQILEQELGKSFTAYVKEDRYAMVYQSKGQQGWMKIIVRLDQGYTYLEYEKSDTITKTKFGSENIDLVTFQRNSTDKKEILGEQCESITLEYKFNDADSPFSGMKGKYYFNPKFKLNPKFYSDYTDGFWNLYVKESGAISIRNEVEYYPIFKSIQEVTAIKEKSVDNAIFKPNPNKVIKVE